MHLLREYRKNGQIIPSILSALTKDSQQRNTNEEEEQAKRARNDGNNKEGCAQKHGGQRSTGAHSMNGPLARRHRKRQVIENDALRGIALVDDEGNDVVDGLYADQPDSSKVTQLVRDITKLRTEMTANKKVELKRTKVSFEDMLRVVHAQERRGSESDTYTDGACSLLRRKMLKMRNPDDSDSALEVTLDAGKGEFKVKHLLPKIEQKRHSISQSVLQPKKKALPATRSFSFVPTISR